MQADMRCFALFGIVPRFFRDLDILQLSHATGLERRDILHAPVLKYFICGTDMLCTRLQSFENVVGCHWLDASGHVLLWSQPRCATLVSGDVAAAEEGVRTMRRDGVCPNVVTYTALVKGHVPLARDSETHLPARCPALEAVFALLEDMRSARVGPDANTFVATMEVCAAARDVESGEEAFVRLVADGAPLNGEVYVALLKLCAAAGESAFVSTRVASFLLHSIYCFTKQPTRDTHRRDLEPAYCTSLMFICLSLCMLRAPGEGDCTECIPDGPLRALL